MAFQTASDNQIVSNVISLEQHQALMFEQRAHFEEIIADLHSQLMKSKELRNEEHPNHSVLPAVHFDHGGNINRRSIIDLGSLIGSNKVEDQIDDDEQHDKPWTGHTRGVTSQLFEELLEFDEDSVAESGDSDDSSSSDDPQNKSGYDAIVLEEQLLRTQCQTTNPGELKEIIETLIRT